MKYKNGCVNACNFGKTGFLLSTLFICFFVNAPDAHGQLAKMISAKSYLKNIEEAVAKGAPIDGSGNKKEYGFFTPLMAAAYSNELDIAQFLLKNGASVNKKNESLLGDKCTAILFAAQSAGDSTDMIKLLLDNGAEIEGNPFCHATPLVQSAYYGNFNRVKALIKSGANPNKISRRGMLPITAGLYDPREGLLTVLEELISAGANVNARDGNGNTALALAIKRGGVNLDVIKLLLAKAAHPELSNTLGETPYDLSKINPEINRLLDENKHKWGKVPADIVQFKSIKRPGVRPGVDDDLYFFGKDKRIDLFRKFNIINSEGKSIWTTTPLVNDCLSPSPVFVDLDGDGSIDFYVRLGECKFQTTFSLIVTYKNGTEAFMIHYDSSKETLSGTEENMTEFMKSTFEKITQDEIFESKYSDLYYTYSMINKARQKK